MLLVSCMNPLKRRCSSHSSSMVSQHLLLIINLHPEGKLEQSLDANKSVFKEQLSLADVAASGKTILHVAGFPRGKHGTKISFCPTLPFLNIYPAAFYCDKQNNKKKKDKRRKPTALVFILFLPKQHTHCTIRQTKDAKSRWPRGQPFTLVDCLCVLEREQKNLPNVIPLWRYKREQSQCSAHTMGLPRSLQLSIGWMFPAMQMDHRSAAQASGLRWRARKQSAIKLVIGSCFKMKQSMHFQCFYLSDAQPLVSGM